MPISRISKAQETGQHICVDSRGPSFVEGTLALAAVILSAGAQYYATNRVGCSLACLRISLKCFTASDDLTIWGVGEAGLSHRWFSHLCTVLSTVCPRSHPIAPKMLHGMCQHAIRCPIKMYSNCPSRANARAFHGSQSSSRTQNSFCGYSMMGRGGKVGESVDPMAHHRRRHGNGNVHPDIHRSKTCGDYVLHARRPPEVRPSEHTHTHHRAGESHPDLGEPRATSDTSRTPSISLSDCPLASRAMADDRSANQPGIFGPQHCRSTWSRDAP